MAIAAMTTNASAHPDINLSSRLRTSLQLVEECPGKNASELRNLRFTLVRFFSCFNGSAEAVLLTCHDFFAAFNQIFGAFAQFTCLALRIFTAFVGLSR